MPLSKPRGRMAALRALIMEFIRPGTREVSGRALWRVGRVVIASTIVITNLIGVAVVLALTLFVVPFPDLPEATALRFFNLLGAAAYVMVAVPLGTWIGIRGLFKLRRWLEEDRPPTPSERRMVFRAPLRLFFVQFGLWFGAALLFGAMNAGDGSQTGIVVATVVALTGLVTAALAYLMIERLMRPGAARALVGQAPGRLAVPGVATRSVVAWAVGTGVPVAGIVAIGAVNLTVGQATRQELSVVMVAIGGIGLSVGLLAVILAARATAGPIDAVRRAMAGIERGDFDSRVSVYDGTQVGQLQLGFNRMADGLTDRERMRELFGTYVDPEVAKRILEEGTELEGEEVEVTILFIDVRGFTAFAERSAAREVVAMLNRLYERAVPVIYRQRGHVNKFVGDGLLAVFGAPTRISDHADRALAAAVEIDRVVSEELGHEIAIGIGLNSGPVLAGNVGGAGRLEFSVIGDSVNVAQRVEKATRQTGDTILVSENTRRLLVAPNVKLVERPTVPLKGKTEEIPLFGLAGLDGVPGADGSA